VTAVTRLCSDDALLALPEFHSNRKNVAGDGVTVRSRGLTNTAAGLGLCLSDGIKLTPAQFPKHANVLNQCHWRSTVAPTMSVNLWRRVIIYVDICWAHCQPKKNDGVSWQAQKTDNIWTDNEHTRVPFVTQLSSFTDLNNVGVSRYLPVINQSPP